MRTGAPSVTSTSSDTVTNSLPYPFRSSFRSISTPGPRTTVSFLILSSTFLIQESPRPLRPESRRIRNEIKRRVFMLIGRKSWYRERHLSSRPLFIVPKKKENLIKRNYVACALIMSLVDKGNAGARDVNDVTALLRSRLDFLSRLSSA